MAAKNPEGYNKKGKSSPITKGYGTGLTKNLNKKNDNDADDQGNKAIYGNGKKKSTKK